MEGKLFKEFKKGAISEKAFKEILLRLQKLPEDPDPMQDLKNWFATKYIKENMKEDSFVSAHFCVDSYYVSIPPKTIQKLVGYATLEMTMNVYTHILNPELSPYIEYFKMLEKDLKERPTDLYDSDTV